MNRNEKAMDLFGNGCNCSQAVLMAYAEDFKLETSILERIAVAFGGGMSKQGKTCGCLSGALMVIGLKFGSDSASIVKNRGISYDKGKEFISIFDKEFGATDCHSLIQLDLNKPRDVEIASKTVFGSRCKNMVGKTVELLDNFLGNNVE